MTAGISSNMSTVTGIVQSSSSSDNAMKQPLKGIRSTTPSQFRQLLPITLCLISFATVLSVLIIYMDTTEIRHQQFRLNMSRDYDLYGVSQDNPNLISYIREIHMRKYPVPYIQSGYQIEHTNFTNRHELTPEMANFISKLLNDKTNGIFIQSLTGGNNIVMTAPWLAETLNWGGYIVEPDPRKYFVIRKQNVNKPKIQVIHACLSPNEYPKEVTLHRDEDGDVKINSILDEESEWFYSRVKCFPLYTIMLAVNKINIDLLSLGCHGQELQILQTVPFDKVHIQIITIHLIEHNDEHDHDNDKYIQSITNFLLGKSYKLIKIMDKKNYVYQITNRHLKTI